MKKLPKNYDHKEAEPRLQKLWDESGVYAWDESQPRENTFVIDTPPPTVSGVLHMGHIFSYTQADFVARYQRMSGKTVFYPMGFDDNGLPTERLVEKIKNKKARDYPSREDFVRDCREVVKSAEEDFRKLFKSVALSVDWKQEYQTISDEVRRLSQESFLDLLKKGEAYRDFRPTYWDWVDQTAIAQAEIENKEMPGVMNEIEFTLEDGTPLIIATTRPELLGACVAVMYHKDDERYNGEGVKKGIKGAIDVRDKKAITPLFDVKVRMIADELVEREKGTGLVMCCTFGDDTDKEWWRKYGLPCRNLISKDGRIAFRNISLAGEDHFVIGFVGGSDGKYEPATLSVSNGNCINFHKTEKAFSDAYVEPVKDDYEHTFDNNEPSEIGYISQYKYRKIEPARKEILKLLDSEGKLCRQTNITHTVKCAERSGKAIEIIPTHQWFIKVIDKKEALLEKGNECKWYPEYMHIRLNQWIEGLKEDWCVSRQRFFGVPFPVWYAAVHPVNPATVWHTIPLNGKITERLIENLKLNPIDPLKDAPPGFDYKKSYSDPLTGRFHYSANAMEDVYDNNGSLIFKANQEVVIELDYDVMDTWATSSISPQINAKTISKESPAHDPKLATRYSKLFPADLRPQAHEIIRTWAFYTIVKAYLHNKDNPDINQQIPWKNLMISGWCLAPDRSKMSKSKGNVITPVDLILDKSADAVRYWASTSRLGADTAFSEELLKIGRKLINKLWNATNFASIHLDGLDVSLQKPVSESRITKALDKWILTRLQKTIAKATLEFERFEYCDARVAVEEFFWKDFCDNYLELVKLRAYGEDSGIKSHKPESVSAHLTLYYCLNAILRLFAPFMPHITEELYGHIFNTGASIHERGNWPEAADYPVDEKAEASGIACVSILEAIRKAKSERQVSIKFPIKEVKLSGGDWKLIEQVIQDLKSAGNVESIVWSDTTLPDAVYTDDKSFSLAITFAKNPSDETLYNNKSAM